MLKKNEKIDNYFLSFFVRFRLLMTITIPVSRLEKARREMNTE